MSSLEATAARQTSVPKELLQRDVAQWQLSRIRNVANALVANAQKAKLMSKWHSRNRDLWAAPKDEAETKGGRRAAGSDEPADAATHKEIEELQNSAPRPKDGSPELVGNRVVKLRLRYRVETNMPFVMENPFINHPKTKSMGSP